MYRVIVNDEVVHKDLPKLSSEWKTKILASIRVKLSANPEHFGEPLRRGLKGYRKLRVGDYRVVYKIEGQTVYIQAIIHRATVYKDILKRV